MDMDNGISTFVANMRAAGQPDELIAENLVAAGHNELMIMNALGVESLSQLEPEEEETSPPPAPSAPTTSILDLVDADGNPLIQDETPAPATPAAPTAPAKPVDRTKPARPRTYPRPAARREPRKQVSSTPKDTGFKKPTAAVAPSSEPKPDINKLAAKEAQQERPNLQELGRKVANQIPHHVAAAHAHRPATPIGTLPKLSQPARKRLVPADKQQPKPALKPKNKGYGHHTFDDFMARIDAHKELPPAHDMELEPGYENEQIDVKALEPEAPKENVEQPQGPGSIHELLEEQKDEAQAGPGGPAMDDLLKESDIDALQQEAEAPGGEAMPAQPVVPTPTAPEIQRVGSNINDVKNSVALKVIVILIGVLVLIGLATSIITQISG